MAQFASPGVCECSPAMLGHSAAKISHDQAPSVAHCCQEQQLWMMLTSTICTEISDSISVARPERKTWASQEGRVGTASAAHCSQQDSRQHRAMSAAPTHPPDHPCWISFHKLVFQFIYLFLLFNIIPLNFGQISHIRSCKRSAAPRSLLFLSQSCC